MIHNRPGRRTYIVFFLLNSTPEPFRFETRRWYRDRWRFFRVRFCPRPPSSLGFYCFPLLFDILLFFFSGFNALRRSRTEQHNTGSGMARTDAVPRNNGPGHRRTAVAKTNRALDPLPTWQLPSIVRRRNSPGPGREGAFESIIFTGRARPRPRYGAGSSPRRNLIFNPPGPYRENTKKVFFKIFFFRSFVTPRTRFFRF